MLYIYSGDVPAFDAAVLDTLGSSHRLTVIPVSAQHRSLSRHVLDHLRQTGFHARLPGARFYRDPRRLRNIIMNSDAIYLMGGNTFSFLAYARKMGLFDIIANFEAAGVLVMAESAGSIILSPTIITALVPTTCADEELIELTNYRGMGRLPFNISPHYVPGAAMADQEMEELQTLTCLTQCPLWVLQDGEGLVLQGERVIDKAGQPLRLDPDNGVVLTDHIKWMPDWAETVVNGNSNRL